MGFRFARQCARGKQIGAATQVGGRYIKADGCNRAEISRVLRGKDTKTRVLRGKATKKKETNKTKSIAM